MLQFGGYALNRQHAAKLMGWLARLSLQRLEVPDILWSKGIPSFCDFAGPTWYQFADTESLQSESFFTEHYKNAQGILWLRLATGARDGKLTDIDIFARSVLHTLQHPVVLITTDGDSAVPSDLNPKTVSAILNCPKVVAWYTQNHDGLNHEKLHPFPIGLDLHTWRGFLSPRALVSKLLEIRKGRTAIEALPPTIFCDAHLAVSSPDRMTIQPKLRDSSYVSFLSRRVAQFELWNNYACHPFIISPRGHGIDCHRTWEILLLGSIVITRPQPIAPLFEGLAVWTINDWDELRDVRVVERQLKILAPLTAREYVWNRLKASTWIDRIRSETSIGKSTL
jgi:hypothetical protein